MSVEEVQREGPRFDRPFHIGDGVYASFDGFQLWLNTDASVGIALEPAVLKSLLEYAGHINVAFGVRHFDLQAD